MTGADVRARILAGLDYRPRLVENLAEIYVDGPAGREFVDTLGARMVERLDAVDPDGAEELAGWWALGEWAEAGGTSGPDYDDGPQELAEELADQAVALEERPWLGDLAHTWADLRAWCWEDDAAEYGPAESTEHGLRVALYCVARCYVLAWCEAAAGILAGRWAPPAA